MKTTSVSLNPELLIELKSLTGMQSYNKIIELCIRAYLVCKKEPQASLWELSTFVSDAKRRNCPKSNVKFTIPEEILAEFEQKLSYLHTRSSKIEQCLIYFIHAFETGNLKRPIQLLGSKWSKKMQEAILNVLDGRNYDTVVETCAGALGIFCCLPSFGQTVLNDIDIDKICLYIELQKNSGNFILDFLRLPISENRALECQKNLKKLKKTVAETSFSVSPQLRHQIALDFLFSNYFIAPRHAQSALLRTPPSLEYLASLFKIAKKLQGVRFKNLNLLTLVPKFNKSKTLIICDPPYPFTDVYADNLSLRDHQKLAKMLRESHSDFIYFCRTTEHISGKPVKTLKLDAFLYDMFASCGCFFQDIETPHGIERIITNFSFAGGTPFAFPVHVDGGKDGE